MNEFVEPGERLEELLYKGLKIIQHPERYCFTSDAVLLAGFIKARRGERLMDVGAGGGVISLLTAGRFPGIDKIYGVEIQEELCSMARRSAALNGLAAKIEVIHAPVQKVSAGFRGAIDAAFCNPPYFKTGSGETRKTAGAAAARHDVHLTLADLAEAAGEILKYKGRFYVIYPANRVAELLCALSVCGVEPKVLQTVQNNALTPPYAVLLEGIKGAKPGLKWLQPHCINQNA
jgi:tRNA1(Val) A37 N6-methylase TrmN6